MTVFMESTRVLAARGGHRWHGHVMFMYCTQWGVCLNRSCDQRALQRRGFRIPLSNEQKYLSAALMDARLKAIGATASLPHSTSLPALRPPAGEPLPNIFDPIGRPQKQETFLAMRARTETREPRAAIQSAYEQQQYIEPRRVFSKYLVEVRKTRGGRAAGAALGRRRRHIGVWHQLTRHSKTRAILCMSALIDHNLRLLRSQASRSSNFLYSPCVTTVVP